MDPDEIWFNVNVKIEIQCLSYCTIRSILWLWSWKSPSVLRFQPRPYMWGILVDLVFYGGKISPFKHGCCRSTETSESESVGSWEVLQRDPNLKQLFISSVVMRVISLEQKFPTYSTYKTSVSHLRLPRLTQQTSDDRGKPPQRRLIPS